MTDFDADASGESTAQFAARMAGQAYTAGGIRSTIAATRAAPDAELERMVERAFDFRPAAIIDMLDLRRPIYRQTAAYGHFGRPELDLPWERTDRIALLK